MSLFKAAPEVELETARRVQFARDSVAHRPFPVALTGWIVRNVLPINFEAYGAVITPWMTSDDRGFHPPPGNSFTGLVEGYRYFGRDVPSQLTLERWHDDFNAIQAAEVLPALFRAIMDRRSSGVEVLYARCYDGQGGPVTNLRCERARFFELEDPFSEMPYPRTDVEVFPAGARWFMCHNDWTPIVYVAGSDQLIEELQRRLDDQFVRVTLEDRYY